ncbi:hypothetical protein [Kitasatospora arboriphila]|uniref:Uncharacterized protein n=1 Tax=Kitasatospora arboriphila TaxID=258052 RepID=A0ABN1U4T4_9ACTN
MPDGTFDFPPDSAWFVDGRLSRYTDARTSFCQGLAAGGFTTRCRRPPRAPAPRTTPVVRGAAPFAGGTARWPSHT